MKTAAIGGFDGMHTAHQELLKRADIFIIIEKGSSITPGFDRCYYTNLGCEYFLLENIKNLTPVEFIEILKKMNVKKLVLGEDFRFGKNRSGDINILKNFFEVEIIKEIKIDGIGVHSHIIRKFIKEDIKKANRFLGRNYKIKGTQIKGQGLGNKKLVPTINIELFKPYIIPKEGVYITKTNNLLSLTFIGIRSTDNNFSIETHIIDNEKWIMNNGKLMEIEFIDFLRENKKFNTLIELKHQIKKDIEYLKSSYKH
ncbi:riboflavin kinase/FMN adenylyltransferase [Lebetimonas natsushimae]|uniref:Riboflavin kinase/FMN adenylyltransferase n=1 Tax=Lebetimonas natsushimae TaxID=1936991 RepID=A0A292YE10_9BACT|nr:bifunctional riboflavin kinase/FAD synthetase [Lebetimonas natsushimae]GAX87563.1 riboflavin kinase/FMN adenylyltransferase [Lebetimonas natsushimae]